jgi:hypothetical protein
MTSPEMISLALNAIGRAFKDHCAVIDALEEDQDTYNPERAVPPRCEWGCAIVSRYITPEDRWVCDVLDSEGPLAFPPSLPEGAMVLEVVTAGTGTRILLTPRVCRELEQAGAKLMGITPVCWGDPEDAELLGPDEPLPSVSISLIPQSIFGDKTAPIPQIQATLTARTLNAPYVLLAVNRPAGLPR